ncbi:MAG: hypothetical protein KF768_12530 [Phycisphaeraceae bacterium]|nr:hypothetical protein [Phycisphaeraceae bacterium]
MDTLSLLAQQAEWPDRLLNTSTLWPLIFGGVVIIWIVTKGIVAVATSNSRERSRREIAAYIAEGSMTAEQGERLMRAGGDKPTA